MSSRPFQVHDADSAPSAAARRALAEVQARRGMVPNLLGALAESELALTLYLEASRLYTKATLDATERQVVMLTVTRLNVAQYCMSANSAMAAAGGMSGELIVALRENRPLADSRLEALRRFTESVCYCRGKVDAAQWMAFEAAGYGREQALEVLVGVALKVFSNFACRMTEVPLDEGFQPWLWRGVGVP